MSATLWVGPRELGVEVAASLAAPLDVRSPGEVGEAPAGCEVLVDATGLLGDAGVELLQAAGAAPPPSLRRIVVVVTTAWLGDADDPRRAAAAASRVAVARSLALRLAPRTTVNTLAVAGDLDPARARLAALAARPDARTLAHWIGWFAAAANDYVTGQTVNLCGGATLLSSLSV